MGRDFVSCGRWPVVLSPDESECDRVSKRDRLGLTPNLTIRDLWRRRRWARGNDNFVYSSLWDFKSSFTCRKILRHGTFPLYFLSERKMCCGFLSPLKMHCVAGFEPETFGSSGKNTNHYTTKAILSQKNLIHIHRTCFTNIHFNIILPSTTRS
jgi:hypothetical protein